MILLTKNNFNEYKNELNLENYWAECGFSLRLFWSPFNVVVWSFRGFLEWLCGYFLLCYIWIILCIFGLNLESLWVCSGVIPKFFILYFVLFVWQILYKIKLEKKVLLFQKMTCCLCVCSSEVLNFNNRDHLLKNWVQ